MKREIEQFLVDIGSRKPGWLKTITANRELVLANLALIAEVPAQTFEEQARADLVLERFIGADLDDARLDSKHNVMGTLPGKAGGGKTILVFAHMDHQVASPAGESVTFTQDRVLGRGVAEDTLALATLLALPDILKRLELQFNRDIILLASTCSHGRGDFAGIRHFIENQGDGVGFAINVEATPLGKINYSALSRTRCDITCEIEAHQGSPWGTMGNTSAIMIVNEIISGLHAIPLPRNPKTIINVGLMSGGERYSTVSTLAKVGLEILSEDDKVMDRIIEEVEDCCIDVAAKHGTEAGDVKMEFFGRHMAAGLSYSHPLVKTAVGIMKELGQKPVIEYSNSELAVPLAASIPSINVGLTTGKKPGSTTGFVDLAPLPTGILQLVMLLQALDKGLANSEDA